MSRIDRLLAGIGYRLHNAVARTLPAADVDACSKACDETTGCVGYQFGGMPPLTSACQIFSTVTKRSVDTRWRSGVQSNLAVALPVAYDQATPALPAPKANPAKSLAKASPAKSPPRARRACRSRSRSSLATS